MDCQPFRYKQRGTRVPGRIPDINGLYDREIYLNICEGSAFFKNDKCDKLFRILTDSSGNGLNYLKFSGANSGDSPIWDGEKFIPIASNLDLGYFNSEGDSQYLNYFARVVTNSANWTYLLKNFSNKLYELNNDEEIYFTIEITAAGADKTALFKFEGGASRGSISSEDGVPFSSSKLLKLVKTIFQRTDNSYDVRLVVDNSDGSIKIQCIGDVDYNLHWYAKIEILRLNIVSVINPYPNLYFSGINNDTDWYNTGNWYSNNLFTKNAKSIPQTGTIAHMCGTSGSYVNLDSQYWITPLLINTLNVSDNNGICFYSNNEAKFTGSLIGNSSYWGNSSKG